MLSFVRVVFRVQLVCPYPSCEKSAAHRSTRKFGDASGARVNEIRLLRENAQRLNVGHWLRNPWRNCETYKHVLLGQGGTLPLAKQTWRDSMRTRKLRGQRGLSRTTFRSMADRYWISSAKPQAQATMAVVFHESVEGSCVPATTKSNISYHKGKIPAAKCPQSKHEEFLLSEQAVQHVRISITQFYLRLFNAL